MAKEKQGGKKKRVSRRGQPDLAAAQGSATSKANEDCVKPAPVPEAFADKTTAAQGGEHIRQQGTASPNGAPSACGRTNIQGNAEANNKTVFEASAMDDKAPESASAAASSPKKKQRFTFSNPRSPSSGKMAAATAALNAVTGPHGTRGLAAEKLLKMKKTPIAGTSLFFDKISCFTLKTITNEIILLFRNIKDNSPSPYMKPYTDWLKEDRSRMEKLSITWMGFECDPDHPEDKWRITKKVRDKKKSDGSMKDIESWCDAFVSRGEPELFDKNTPEFRARFAKEIVDCHNEAEVQGEYYRAGEYLMVHKDDFEAQNGQENPEFSVFFGISGTVEYLKEIIKTDDVAPTNQELLEGFEDLQPYFAKEHWEAAQIFLGRPRNPDEDGKRSFSWTD